MPAAAVIPALPVHRTIAAVKKLVVGSLFAAGSLPRGCTRDVGIQSTRPLLGLALVVGGRRVYLEQIRVLRTGIAPECSCME